MVILIRVFATPDEEMNKIVLKVVKQYVQTDGVDVLQSICPNLSAHHFGSMKYHHIAELLHSPACFLLEALIHSWTPHSSMPSLHSSCYFSFLQPMSLSLLCSLSVFLFLKSFLFRPSSPSLTFIIHFLRGGFNDPMLPQRWIRGGTNEVIFANLFKSSIFSSSIIYLLQKSVMATSWLSIRPFARITAQPCLQGMPENISRKKNYQSQHYSVHVSTI